MGILNTIELYANYILMYKKNESNCVEKDNDLFIWLLKRYFSAYQLYKALHMSECELLALKRSSIGFVKI